MEPLRILVLESYQPFPPNSGGRIASCDVLDHLIELGHEVDVVCLQQDWDDNSSVGPPASLNARMGYWCTTSPEPHVYLWWQRLARVALKGPAALLYRPREAAVALLTELTRTRHYSLVLCSNLLSAIYLGALQGAPRPVVYRAQNFEQEIAWTSLRERPSFVGLVLLLKLKVFENHCLRRFDSIASIAPPVTDQIRRVAPGVPTATIGVSLSRFPVKLCAAGAADPSRPALLVGDLAWPPNEAALVWFVEMVMPLIRTAGFSLVAVSRTRTHRAEILTRQFGQVQLVDTEDVAELYARSSLVVAPIHEGSGLRLKVLEAGLAGKPLVCTSRCARASALTQEREALVADTPEGFARAIDRLLEDAAFAGGLAERLQSSVLRQCDSGHIRAQWQDLLAATRAKGVR